MKAVNKLCKVKPLKSGFFDAPVLKVNEDK
jgi:hypothetical protein